MTDSVVGILIPTLGTRNNLLVKTIQSIRSAGKAHIALISPNLHLIPEEILRGVNQAIIETKKSLPGAINEGISKLPQSCAFISWIGDDDLLAPESLQITSKILDENPDAAFVFGRCNYIDEQGKTIAVNRSGQWAERYLAFLPDLIPQPGSLIRRKAFHQVSGLNEELNFAFDFNLFLDLKKVGLGIFEPTVLASFRWHPDSLSVKDRNKAVVEASHVRKTVHKSNLLIFAWEPVLRIITRLAGKLLTFKFTRKGNLKK